MALSENTIKSVKGSTKTRKRVGRGNSSGSGTYSGRGQKGQNARAGVSGLKRLGMKQILLRIPKKRGFKSLLGDMQVINVSTLNKFFKDGDKVTPKILAEKGIIDSASEKTKILGQGILKVKSLSFSKLNFSKSAKEQVEKLSGKIN